MCSFFGICKEIIPIITQIKPNIWTIKKLSIIHPFHRNTSPPTTISRFLALICPSLCTGREIKIRELLKTQVSAAKRRSF
jgi:hypothetical protein